MRQVTHGDHALPPPGPDEPAPPAGREFDLDQAARLRRVITRLARALNESASSQGLTPTQASVLGAIVGRGPLPAAELVRIEGVNPTMLSRVLGALEERGLIVRSTADDDQRRIVAEATTAGREVGGRIRERRAQVLLAVVAGQSGEVVARIRDALSALDQLADALEGRGPTGSIADR